MFFLFRLIKWLIILIVLLCAAIIISGKTYIFKGVSNTYLKGRSGPAIDEYKIFPYREVKAGAYKPWPIGFDYNKKQLPDTFQAYLNKLETIAYVVVQNDSIRYEGYWDSFENSSITNSFSMAKTITSILVGIAVDEGKIKSIDQPIGDFLPAYKEGAKAKITFRHLLTMSSGLDFDEDYVNPLAYPAAAYYGDDLEKLTYKYDVKEEPGKKVEYLSGNTQILGFALEKAVGMPVSDYASEKLWKPIGAKHNAYWNLDKEDGHEKYYCCFNSNAQDFARLGELFLDSGKWDGQQVVSAKYVKESVTPAPLTDVDGNPNKKYGYSWWLMNYKGMEIFYERGILGQYIIVIPQHNMVVVRLGKKREKEKIEDHPVDVFRYIDFAVATWGNK
jgi:CubicO group peptidase (beta-lactamase class C family)